jgi:PiT family inorganic phosphate transporter|nr:anion permease [Kofleriaceae bacterium]
MSPLLIAVIVASFVFDYTNGFHDAANAIATSISTRALKPRTALAMAAVLNLVGALLSTSVAATVAKGLVDPTVVTLETVFGGLVGAVAWNLITWWWGLPSSSSHCLLGGVVGAVLGAYGNAGVNWSVIAEKVLLPTVTSPVVGFVMGGILVVVMSWLVRRWTPARVQRNFRRMQTVSAALMSLSHGQNDAQKTMGVILLALIAGHQLPANADVPTWVIVGCAAAMSLGTYAGGKRIIKTLGMRLVALRPIDGFAAETASAAVLFTTGQLGFPVSTTHVITTAVLGVGATQNVRGVRWGLGQRIVIAWLMTFPAAGAMGALVAYLLNRYA